MRESEQPSKLPESPSEQPPPKEESYSSAVDDSSPPSDNYSEPEVEGDMDTEEAQLYEPTLSEIMKSTPPVPQTEEGKTIEYTEESEQVENAPE